MQPQVDTQQSLTWQGKGLKDFALLYVKGIAMGLGDSVPGVSGGTIAVITSIYDTLIYSIRKMDLILLQMILRGQIALAWQHCNGNFLVMVAAGILTGLLLSARTVLYLLDNYYAALMAFFIGLVLASVWLLRDRLDWRQPVNLALVLAGVLLTVGVGFLDPQAASISLPYLFVCGAVAICAMILPGLSGAFILLLLGAYEFILEALLAFDVAAILVFIAGCGIGLLAFSRVLAWLLLRHHEKSYAAICGLLLGSLSVLWPWQRALTFYTDSDGIQQPLRSEHVSPFQYAELTGDDPMLALAAVALALGLAVVLLLHRTFADTKG